MQNGSHRVVENLAAAWHAFFDMFWEYSLVHNIWYEGDLVQSGDPGGNDRHPALAGQLLHEPVQKTGIYSVQRRASSPQLTAPRGSARLVSTGQTWNAPPRFDSDGKSLVCRAESSRVSHADGIGIPRISRLCNFEQISWASSIENWFLKVQHAFVG